MASPTAIPLRHVGSRSFLAAVCKVQPYHFLLAGLIPGFALIAGSMVLHIDSVWAVSPAYANTSREVGYLWALNWSLSYALLFPILLFLTANTLSGLALALDRLHSHGMVRAQSFLLAPPGSLTDAWLVGNDVRKWLMITFSVVTPTAIGLVEWLNNNLLRLIRPPSILEPWNYDWGLAGIIRDWSLAHRLINALFDLAAFITEALLIASLVAFFIAVLDLGRIIPSGKINEDFRLIPDFKSKDKRLGFEAFEDPLENLLAAAFVAYLICYLVRLQGAYMASKTASSLADFVTSDIIQGVVQAASKPSPQVLASTFSHLLNLGDQQTRGVLAWLLSVFLAVFSLTAVVMTVRAAAKSAKLNGYEALNGNALGLSPGENAAASRKLDRMVVWPLGYLRLDALLFWIAIAVGTLLLYRVGLFIAGFVAFTLFFRLIRRLFR